MERVYFDVAHLFAGSLVLVSFILLYQDRLTGLINVFTIHAVVLSLSVGWQAYAQHAPHLYITAGIAVVFKAVIIPFSLSNMMERMGIHREIEVVGGIGVTMLVGIALVALSLAVVLPATAAADPPGPRGYRLRPFGRAARAVDDGDAAQRRQSGDRLHVA
jgi:hydrogenase-4 component E